MSGENMVAMLDGLYNPDADGWVYVIKVKRAEDTEEFYYVGMSQQDESGFRRRIKNHGDGMSGVQFPAPGDHGDVYVSRDMAEKYDDMQTRTYFGVSVMHVHSYHQQPSESDEEFKFRLLEEERRLAYDTAREYDTSNVVGGK